MKMFIFNDNEDKIQTLNQHPRLPSGTSPCDHRSSASFCNFGLKSILVADSVRLANIWSKRGETELDHYENVNRSADVVGVVVK